MAADDDNGCAVSAEGADAVAQPAVDPGLKADDGGCSQWQE